MKRTGQGDKGCFFCDHTFESTLHLLQLFQSPLACCVWDPGGWFPGMGSWTVDPSNAGSREMDRNDIKHEATRWSLNGVLLRIKRTFGSKKF
ncbi:hypothetical protein Dimus_031405 [Dionaea muscipula]